MEFMEHVKLEVIKAVFGLITLGVGWLLGQRVIAFWDLRKKRQELYLETAAQFHNLYGEFKEVARLWRAYKYDNKELVYPGDIPVELVKRSTAAEGGVEAIIMKLATERQLSEEDFRTLGLFRQAYQRLRETIRGNEDFKWTRNTPQYHLYNELASKIALIITSNKSLNKHELVYATDNFKRITNYDSNDWKDAVDNYSIAQG